MRVLVTGSGGMLGREVCTALLRRGYEVVPAGLRRGEVLQDLAEIEGTVRMVQAAQPDVVIHCAAYTDVDGAEEDPATAFRVNATGTWNLAIACCRKDVPLCAISTDFVFDGLKPDPYTEWDEPRPINVYGASKLAAERAIREVWPKHWIVRTAWLYGVHGRCFPEAVLAAAEREHTLNVVADQTGSPTYAGDLAAALAALISTPYFGTYHIANSGRATRYEFAKAILQMAHGASAAVHPIVSSDRPSPARRPRNSALASAREEVPGYGPMRPWPQALAEYIRERAHSKNGEDPRCC
ncbi:MAG: dTDP-4-dehydrorhamnose reductase [Chthonomonadales bacterium]